VRAHEIRADYDRSSIVVYQAYSPEIGRAAAQHGKFVPPFSRGRMTWITGIEDLTPLVRKIRRMIDDGSARRASDLLPRERVYPLSPELAGRIGADS
jgi:predicted oxidoreductase